MILQYKTEYEAVADFLAEDMEKWGESQWVGKAVGVREVKDGGKGI